MAEFGKNRSFLIYKSLEFILPKDLIFIVFEYDVNFTLETKEIKNDARGFNKITVIKFILLFLVKNMLIRFEMFIHYMN